MAIFSDHSKRLVHWTDLVFFAAVLLFAFFAVRGSLVISAEGTIIDSDLATYAEGMAGAAHPELFALDPMLQRHTEANSIRNLERMLAEIFVQEDGFAPGLIQASGVILVFFFLSWYVFGRWLLGRRDFALLLLLAVSITVWVGFGTFWGITHSDPVPRVFHAAFFPWMLMLAILGWDRALLRPLVMLLAGLGMWLHGVSALNCGAMFFVAFFFHRPKALSCSAHFLLCLISLLAFFAPVLIFLWPTLTFGRIFTAHELAVFHDLFVLRWHEDYGNITGSLLALITPNNPVAWLLYGGFVASIIVRFLPYARAAVLARMLPFFVLALTCVVVFSLLESHYVQQHGRVPMGHELVRGVKFLIPLAWISIVTVFAFVLSRLPRAFASVFVLCAFLTVVLLTKDRQLLAAESAFTASTGITLPLTARAQKLQKSAEEAREAIEQIKKTVPAGEAVFCLEDCMMAVRYMALRPLVYSFKDGFAHYYSKDVEQARDWLGYARLTMEGREGIRKAFLQSQAPWYLCPKAEAPLTEEMHKVWENAAWSLWKRP